MKRPVLRLSASAASMMRDFHCFVMLVSGLYIFLLCATPASSDKSLDCFVVTIYGLKTAKCNNLNLKTIPKDLDTDLKVLEFSDNQLTYLGNDEFQNYQRIQEIYLVRNRIEVIAPDAFRGLRNLQILELEGNKLHKIPQDTFQHLSSVRIITFKSNPIRLLTEHSFDMLKSIEELNFENCWLERIDPGVFAGLSNLNEVNLVNNELKTLDSAMMDSLPKSLQVFRLYRNPWQCDCHLRWLQDWISKSGVNWDFAHNTPTCNGPPIIRTINWKLLTPDQFACAARIITKSNTTNLEVTIGTNVTIVCNVFGDPEPKIEWKRGDLEQNKIGTIRKVEIENKEEKQFKSSLTLHNVQQSMAGDYKCLAKNNAGTSEVTYKVWIAGIHTETDTGETTGEETGMSKEAYLGIGVAVAVVLLLIVICAIYCLKQREQKRHEYKVRDYKKPTSMGTTSKDGSAFDEEDQIQIKEKAAKESIAIAEPEKKELLDKKDSKGSHASKRDNQIVTKAQTTDIIPAENKHLLPKNEPILEEKDKKDDETDSTFQMKIFSTYSEQQKEQIKRDKERELETKTQQQDQEHLGATSPHANEPEFTKANGKVQNKDTVAPPDILRNGKHSGVPTHKVSGVPVAPPTVPNHLESSHQRAAENPYAKPSELRPVTRKSGSADDLLDCKHHSSLEPDYHSQTMHHRSKDKSREKEVTFRDPPTMNRVKIRDPSPKSRSDHHKHCNNPVCLKDHTLMPDAPQLRGSQSLTGMNTVGVPGGLQEIDVDDIVDPVYHRGPGGGGGGTPGGISDRYVDRYRTLPSKSSRYPGGSGGAGPKHYSPPTTAIHSPGTRGGGGGGAAVSPYQTLPGRGSSSPTKFHQPHRTESPSRGVLDRYGGFPPPPPSAYLPARGAISSPEDNITYGPFSTSPQKAPRRAFQGSATLDELLSPPFAHIASGQRGPKTAQAKKLPKPGEKDEFGTAV